jgi:hypothetical protein
MTQTYNSKDSTLSHRFYPINIRFIINGLIYY